CQSTISSRVPSLSPSRAASRWLYGERGSFWAHHSAQASAPASFPAASCAAICSCGVALNSNPTTATALATVISVLDATEASDGPSPRLTGAPTSRQNVAAPCTFLHEHWRTSHFPRFWLRLGSVAGPRPAGHGRWPVHSSTTLLPFGKHSPGWTRRG